MGLEPTTSKIFLLSSTKSGQLNETALYPNVPIDEALGLDALSE